MTERTDRPIQVGDLAWIYLPSLCCNDKRNVGRIVRVSQLGQSPSNFCSGCFKTYSTPLFAYLSGWRGQGNGWIDVRRLKRIPPLSELEGVKTDEPIKEPA